MAAAFLSFWNYQMWHDIDYTDKVERLKVVLVDREPSQIEVMQTRLPDWYREKPGQEVMRFIASRDFEKIPDLAPATSLQEELDGAGAKKASEGGEEAA